MHSGLNKVKASALRRWLSATKAYSRPSSHPFYGWRRLTLEGKTYSTHFSLIQFEQRLPESVFFRCHRNYIVNIDEVRQIEPWFNHQYVLILRGQEKDPVPVGRSYLKKLRQYIYL